MSPRRVKFSRASRIVQWLWPTVGFALAPKCLLCVASYAGIGAALGLARPELCGAPSGSPGSWASSLALPGAALSAIGIVAAMRRGRASVKV